VLFAIGQQETSSGCQVKCKHNMYKVIGIQEYYDRKSRPTKAALLLLLVLLVVVSSGVNGSGTVSGGVKIISINWLDCCVGLVVIKDNFSKNGTIF